MHAPGQRLHFFSVHIWVWSIFVETLASRGMSLMMHDAHRLDGPGLGIHVCRRCVAGVGALECWRLGVYALRATRGCMVSGCDAGLLWRATDGDKVGGVSPSMITRYCTDAHSCRRALRPCPIRQPREFSLVTDGTHGDWLAGQRRAVGASARHPAIRPFFAGRPQSPGLRYDTDGTWADPHCP